MRSSRSHGSTDTRPSTVAIRNDSISPGIRLAQCSQRSWGVDLSWMKKDGIPTKALRGIAPVSGRYDLRAEQPSAFTPTPQLQEQASSVAHIKHPAARAVIALGSTETPIMAGSRALTDQLAAAGTQATLVTLAGADHKDTVLGLADEHSPLFQAVSAMILGTPPTAGN